MLSGLVAGCEEDCPDLERASILPSEAEDEHFWDSSPQPTSSKKTVVPVPISSTFYVRNFCTKVRSKSNSKQRKAAQKTFARK